jgi:hypothetical protein
VRHVRLDVGRGKSANEVEVFVRRMMPFGIVVASIATIGSASSSLVDELESDSTGLVHLRPFRGDGLTATCPASRRTSAAFGDP